MTLDDLRRQVDQKDQVISRLVGQRDRVTADLSKAKTELEQVRKDVVLEQQIQDILNKAAVLSWDKTRGRIESLVTRALKAVFHDRNYSFVLEQETKRGASSVSFIVVEDGLEVDIWEDGGLGVADVVGFALRIAYLAMYRPAVRPVLLFDEPLKNMYPSYRTNAARFMRQLAEELGLQFILVTHIPELIEEADQIFDFNRLDGTCKVVELGPKA